MRYFTIFIVCLLISSACSSLDNDLSKPYALNKDSYFIADYLFNKKSAVSSSWDDNCSSHIDIARIFSSYGYETTFFLNPGHSGFNLDTIKNILSLNHEIGSHSITHPNLPELDSVEIINEVFNSKLILDNLFDINVVSFAHPRNRSSELVDSIIYKYYLTTRKTPKFSCLYNYINSKTSLKDIENSVDYSQFSGRWLHCAGHGIDGDGYEPINSVLLKSCLELLNIKNIWCSTVGRVAFYKTVKNQISISQNRDGYL